jgi:two-component system, LuxR family, sensor kinase FixL
VPRLPYSDILLMPADLSAPNALQALLDATVDAVIIIDHRGAIATFNRSAERMFGYARDEVIGCNVNMLMTAADHAQHDDHLARYGRTGVAHIIGIGREVEARRRDGSEFPVHLSVGRIEGSDPPRYVGLLHDITLRRENFRALQQQRDRARQYLNVAQVVLVVLDTGGRVLLLNQRGCELLGRGESEIVGMSWLDVAVSPQDRGRASRKFALAADPATTVGTEFRCEYQLNSTTGQDRLIDWRCITVQDPASGGISLLCSGDDITERRAAERSVDQLRQLLEQAQSIAHIGNYVVTWPESPLDYWSPEVHRIFGFDPAAQRASAAALTERVHPEDSAALYAEFVERIKLEGIFESDYRIVRPGGETRWIHTKYRLENTPDGRKRAIGTVIDVTDTVRAAQETQLAQQRMAHVSNLATMGEMAAGFAHEINQPLAAIANFAQASRRLLDRPDPDLTDIRDAVTQISEQALRAGEIIRRMRRLVKKQDTDREWVPVEPLIEDVLGLCASDARLNEVRVRVHCAPSLPHVHVDRIQIQQVLLNLVRNAIDAIKHEPVDNREVGLRMSVDGGDCLIEVCDAGPGVPEQIERQIFEPFVTTKSDGTGLGLAISRSIVKAHNGTLDYHANQPRGACFSVRLPIEAGSA